GSDLREFAGNLLPVRQRVNAIRREMRGNQALWAQRNPRLRAQAAIGESVFGATEELTNLADADRFLTWISDEVRPHLGHRVLEVGAGMGAIATKLAAAGHEVLAIEPADNVFPELERRTAGTPRMTVRKVTSQQLLASGEGGFDSIVYVSVLEHIRDDVAELRIAHDLLAPGGSVVLFVPAMPSLYGSLDFKSGHYRRYDRALLRSVIDGAGLELGDTRYLDVAGVVPYFLMYRVFGVPTLHAGSSKVFDSLIVPVSRFLQRRVASPGFGKNLLAVGRRPLR
ncbi:MAG: class I SAM-dependent methyltransferase, partial [Actinomycetota bacterium]